MKCSLKLLFLTTYLFVPFYSFSFTLPFYTTTANILPKQAKKTVVINNDLIDATNLFHIAQDDEILLQKNIAAVQLKVNGQHINNDEIISLTLEEDICTFTITLRGDSCAPFFQPSGILKKLARFMYFDITFTYEHPSDGEEISVLLVLAEKIDQWKQELPHIALHYSPPLVVHILLTDGQIPQS